MKHDLLSDESIGVLRTLLGRTVHTIFAPHLDAAGAHLSAWKLAMLLAKDHFINFSCEWSETPQILNDSWLITVTTSTEPIGIKRNDSGALIAPCNIRMYKAQPIRSILVYEYRDDSDEIPEESVHYDRAIIFQREDGQKFCIACMLNGPGIATDLHFSEDVKVIEEMIDGSTIRLVLE